MRNQTDSGHGSHRRAVARALAVVVSVLVVTSCAASDPSTSATGTSAAALAPMPTSSGPDTVPFRISVTNGSHDIPEVRLVIELDGEAIIDDAFLVKNDHDWADYDLQLDPGPHDITVTAPEHGVDMTESFTLDGQRWSLVQFNAGGDGGPDPRLSWQFSEEQIMIE